MKTKTKSKKVTKTEVDPNDLDLQEVSLLEVDSTDGDATQVLDVSKTPDFTVDFSTLKTWIRDLDDTTRLRVYTNEFTPWFISRNKERMQSLNEDLKKLNLFNDKLKRTAVVMKKADDKKAAKKNNSSKDRPYGFNSPIKVPKKILQFLKKNLLEEDENVIEYKKKDGSTNQIEVMDVMKRSDITSLLYWYCELKNLKNEDDKRIITPDKALKSLFGKALSKNENLTFSNFQTKLKVLFDEESSNNKTKKV